MVSAKTMLLAAAGALALGACESVEEEVTEAVGKEYQAILTGPGGASGKADITLDDTTNRICTDLELSGAGNVTAAHIHSGGGGVVVRVDVPDDNDSDDCDTVPDGVVDMIRRNPGAFYVDAHTSAGVIRGALRKE